MTNLLEETKDILRVNSKTPREVLWVGNKEGYLAINWNQFIKISNVEYDSGYGSAEIACDLVVVGKDWWLERYEYDGSEGWRFYSTPIAEHGKPFKTVKQGMWESLEEMNKW